MAATTVAILDVSATAHMPDVLEMPYRPEITSRHGATAGKPGAYEHTYRLGGNSCLAGDVIGDFSFPDPLHPGDTLVFEDMAQYTMVKTTFFNGFLTRPSSCATRTAGSRRSGSFPGEDFGAEARLALPEADRSSYSPSTTALAAA